MAEALRPWSVPGGHCEWAGLARAPWAAPKPAQASQLPTSAPLAAGGPLGPSSLDQLLRSGWGLLLFLLPDSLSESRSKLQPLDTLLPDLRVSCHFLLT